VQVSESWMTNNNAQYYQPNNQQPFFVNPNFDQSQVTWPRHDSYYPTEDHAKSDGRAQGFNDAQAKDTGFPMGVTMVPRNANDTFPGQQSAARRGRVTDS
jgi:hypothetical protein